MAYVTRCYLEVSLSDEIDVDECPADLLPSLVDATTEEWSGWCKCGWSMPGVAFDAETVANAWGDHVAPNSEPRILFAQLPPSHKADQP